MSAGDPSVIVYCPYLISSRRKAGAVDGRRKLAAAVRCNLQRCKLRPVRPLQMRCPSVAAGEAAPLIAELSTGRCR